MDWASGAIMVAYLAAAYLIALAWVPQDTKTRRPVTGTGRRSKASRRD